MKNALGGLCLVITGLIMTACNNAALQVNASSLTPGDISQLAQQVDPSVDATLDPGTLGLLLVNNTLITRSFSNPNAVQYGFFGRDGGLIINPQPGVFAVGSWRLTDNGICYDLDAGTFCSTVHVANVVKEGRVMQAYYFARQGSRQPTVIFTQLISGNQIPGDKSAG